MERPFVTLRGQGECSLEIKRSRFIGVASRLADDSMFHSWLTAVRRAHPDASHHAFAYRIGHRGECARFSDDGEPGGTAGRPIMEALLREECVDAGAIVTRYFGGTLLGSGGLTRAYGQAATAAMRDAGFARMAPHTAMSIVLEYQYFGALEQTLAHSGYALSARDFAERVTAVVHVPIGEEPRLETLAADLSAGSAMAHRGEIVYLPV